MISLTIPDEIIKTTRMSATEIIRELAIVLFQKEKLTLGQASSLSKMNQFQFQHLLASRQIPIHYSKNDFEQDIKTLKGLGRS